MEDLKQYRPRIDQLLATQKEIGPVVPDGGYGWIILLGSVFYYISIPSVSISYGVFLMYSTLETTDHTKILFWDNSMINAPLYFIVSWTVMDPISKKIVRNSKWPRLVILSSICLVCSGILCFWLATINSLDYTKFIYKIGGIFTGCGCSLTLIQLDIIIRQYFHLKLYKVKTLLISFRMLGFIIIPCLLGKYIDAIGLTHVIGWYHLFLIFGTVLCFIFKKPGYLKDGKLKVHNINRDDEEDVFTKSSTELRITRDNDYRASKDENEASTSGTGIGTASVLVANNDDDFKKEWVTFDDDKDFQHEQHDQELEIPKELFSLMKINNNMTYSFDDDLENEQVKNLDAYVFISEPKDEPSTFDFLKCIDFYLATLQLLVNKSTEFTFYTIYPSYLYYGSHGLHQREIGGFLAYIFLGSLLTLTFVQVKDFNYIHKNVLATSFSWIICFGFYLCTDFDLIQWKFFGGILSASCLVSLSYITERCFELDSKNQSNCRAMTMHLITGILLCGFMITDFTYRNCLRGIGLLQFGNGLIRFCIYVFEKIKMFS